MLTRRVHTLALALDLDLSQNPYCLALYGGCAGMLLPLLVHVRVVLVLVKGQARPSWATCDLHTLHSL